MTCRVSANNTKAFYLTTVLKFYLPFTILLLSSEHAAIISITALYILHC